MSASQKRIGHFVLIIFVAAVYFLIPDLFSSCERFDYERVIIIETGSVTEIISDAAKITGQVIDLGEGKIVEHGHIWAEKSENKELTTTLGTQTRLGSITSRGDFTSKLNGLSPDTDYEVRAYATNSKGTVYGKVEYFRTPIQPDLAPEANFEADETFVVEGELVEFTDLSTNNPTSWFWNFGDDQTSTEQNPIHRYSTLGYYSVSLTVSNIYGSDEEIKYEYIEVIAVQSGPVADFIAEPTTISAGENVQFSDLSFNTPTDWYWDFGDGGSSTFQNPLHTYESAGIYSVSLMVSNPYGSDTLVEEDFITVNESIIITEIFTDERDNHEYTMVRLGDQVWMAENLAYLPEVNPPEDYSSVDPVNYVYGYTFYDTAEAKALPYYETYGVLYNWISAIQSCPDGWHLPSTAEWQQLIDYLGGESVAGGKLKEAGTFHWNEPNTGADNSSEFTALPGGTYYYDTDSHFSGAGRLTYWWSSEGVSSDTVFICGLSYDKATIRWVTDVTHNGNSIRCIRDDGGRSLKKHIPDMPDDYPILFEPGK